MKTRSTYSRFWHMADAQFMPAAHLHSSRVIIYPPKGFETQGFIKGNAPSPRKLSSCYLHQTAFREQGEAASCNNDTQDMTLPLAHCVSSSAPCASVFPVSLMGRAGRSSQRAHSLQDSKFVSGPGAVFSQYTL